METREHVDLWLHGFALLQADSSLVPYFKLGYRDELSRARRSINVTTRLDENYLVLSRRVAALTSAQFVALYFNSWEDLRRGCQRFLRDEGNVRAAGDRETLRLYATLATYFPSSADREWLRLFLESLDDERARFHHNWWLQEQSVRASVRGQAESMWNSRYATAFHRFLRHTSQPGGRVLLALPLGGEGRSIDVGEGDHFIAVTFPKAGEDPRDALIVLAHEAVGAVSNQVVRDNTTPADQQSGEAGRLQTLAAVRGGALLLERVAPDLAVEYRQYYLRAARQTISSNITAQFERVFPLPAALASALAGQVDLVLEGI